MLRGFGSPANRLRGDGTPPAARYEHFPEKWTPVFRKKCNQ
jgi:hypothetical protein